MRKPFLSFNRKILFTLTEDKNIQLVWYICHHSVLCDIISNGFQFENTKSQTQLKVQNAKKKPEVTQKNIDKINNISRKTNKFVFYLDKISFIYLWKIIEQSKIDPNLITFIGIKIKDLLPLSTQKWIYTKQKQTLIIKEKINPKVISAVMIHPEQKNISESIQQTIKNHKSPIKFFFGAHLVN